MTFYMVLMGHRIFIFLYQAKCHFGGEKTEPALAGQQDCNKEIMILLWDTFLAMGIRWHRQ